MMRRIQLNMGDLELAGDLFLPPEAKRADAPAIVMSQGFGALKDMSIPPVAEAFAAAGFVVLLYDHRNFGESPGVPRQEVDAWQQVRDMREVISHLRNLPEVDPSRIGLWGTSFSGGHAIVVSAIDRRIRCAVAQVPFVSGSLTVAKGVPAEKLAERIAAIEKDYDARARGVPPMRQAISIEGTEGNIWSRMAGAGTKYMNECTLRSLDSFASYEPGDYVARVSPTPLLFIVAKKDTRCPIEDQLQVYDRAREPKKLVTLEGGHFDPYSAQRDNATEAAMAWFRKYLKP
jgi:fermentation-respiration switch protein FrsA (DUF1100 family)